MDATGALVVGGESEIDVYRLAGSQLSLLKAQATAFAHSFDRELGGGPRFRSTYLLDVDGDAIDDLVEYQRDPAADLPRQLAIHSHIAETAVSAPVILDVPGFWSSLAESPFAAIGAMKGRLLVSDAGGDLTGVHPATIRALN